MAFTYDSIQTYTATGSQNQITFSSITQTYTDLVLIINAQGTVIYEDVNCYLNSDNGSSDNNYMFTQMTAVNTTLAGAGYWAQPRFRVGDYLPNSGTYGASETHFLNYSNTSVKKTIIINSFMAATQQLSALYNSTTAISTIKIGLGGLGNFVAGSTFSLYGIKAA
jgi:hypothetical protein